MFAYMMTQFNRNVFYHFKNCRLSYLTFVILVAIFLHVVVLSRHTYRGDSFLELEPPLTTVNKWKKIPYSVSPILHDHQLYSWKSINKLNAPMSVSTSEISYSSIPVPPTDVFMASKDLTREEVNPDLSEFSDFYYYIKRPQFHCSKIVRMGGEIECEGNALHSQMDGQKLICMDPQMELKAKRNPSDCLTLSFGIANDVSFDEAIASFNCEVHMFDPSVWKPGYTVSNQYPHAHVHRAALDADDRYLLFPKNNNYSVGAFTLQEHLFNNGLEFRPIHILKIDIEMYEWKVLKENLLKTNILHTVGQIAMEIHTKDLVLHLHNATTATRMTALQDKYNILRDLESYGFLPVSYWDNVQDTYAFYDDAGQRFETAGEILYVNTNWYNQTIKQELVKNGIKLKIN